MKRPIILLILLQHFFYSNAQTFDPKILDDDFQLYNGLVLKLKNELKDELNKSFYNDLKYCQSVENKNVIYPDSTENFKTVNDSLANRIFIIENISSFNYNPIFILRDTSTKQVIYYKWNQFYDFPFNILNDEKTFFCSKIERKVDEFTGVINLSSPILSKNKISSMIIYKEINKSKTSYFLCLRTIGSTVNVYETGVIILFDDGTKWTKPDKIDVDAGNNGFEYKAFIALTQADLITFSTKQIKKFRLYIYDQDINSNDATKFKIFSKCIKDAK